MNLRPQKRLRRSVLTGGDAVNTSACKDLSTSSSRLLEGHTAAVNRVVVFPVSRNIATACDDGYVRIFSCAGSPLNSFQTGTGAVLGLAALEGDVVASGGQRAGVIATHTASSGEELDCVSLGGACGAVSAIAAVSEGRIVAGSLDGTLFFILHENGRKMRLLTTAWSGCGSVWDISVRGNSIVTSGSENGPSVRNAKTLEAVASVKAVQIPQDVGSPCAWAQCVAVSDSVIAVGSFGETVSLFANSTDCSLIRVLDGPSEQTRQAICHVAFLAENLLVYAITGKIGVSRLYFTTVTGGHPSAFIDVSVEDITSIAVTSGGLLACVGCNGERAVIVTPPPDMAAIVDASRGNCSGKSAVAKKEGTTKAISCEVQNPKTVLQAHQTAGSSAPFVQAHVGQPVKLNVDWKEMKNASNKKEVLETANIELLSRIVGSAMIGFQVELQLHLHVLTKCLCATFRKNAICGDAILCFPERELYEMLIGPLRNDEEYIALGKGLAAVLEWRLERYLHSLRSGEYLK